ncbi:MAG TPA: FAD-binding and (Fe-S)-binding domain-containing protein [Kofleriaceae bacterium]|jgi:FAD/FMN-containing dehydrogenase/Fe-S oxidoreductase|nr:FAD-binding and (Fe-S)-binding domain-containing protein [Kofleriaceae bacterium]
MRHDDPRDHAAGGPVIPASRLRRPRADPGDSALATALGRELDGEVRFDRGTRALYATDASNYRQVPIGVVIPRTADDVVAAIALCRAHGAPIVMRGGGTSLAGQTCNEAVVIDCSRHLTQVTVDREARTAEVGPGTIMTALRKAANAVGLDFGPDPSTSDRCTLGGMLGNNSCGVHSVFSEFYGPGPRTSDHVEALDVVTYRGQRLTARAVDAAELRRVRDLGGDLATIYDRVLALRDRLAPEIRRRFPDMPRRVSGYNLPDLLDDHGCHMGRALVGSESTCVVILGARLSLMPARPARALAVLGYPDIYTAAAAANQARAERPIGCEAMDDVLIQRIRRQHRDHDHAIALLPAGRAWLMVEHGAATLAEARAAAEHTARVLDPHAARILVDDHQREALAAMREQALGVDAFEPGKPDNYEGWEDSAVPPDRLAPYLRALHALYDQYDLHGSLYGHFAQGCVHTRIDFGLDRPEGVARYRRFTEDAARLVVAHGGSLSGEHGDGQSKADLHGIMFGPALVAGFDEFKTIWDPDRAMNPGKLASPAARTSHLRLVDYRPDPGPIELDHGDDHHDFGHAAVRCVGIGKCRKRDAGAMCPSYMATLDERHSTRGRAHLLFEMLRGDVITDGWRSEEVRESLELCLACKACKKECPTHVDMASYKAEFMAHYYDGRPRSREAYVFGWLHRWLALGRPFARLANAVTHAPGLGALAKRVAGIAPAREIPRLAPRSFRRTFRPPAAAPGAPRVILWPDTFNDAFYPGVLHDAVRVLAAAGYAVEIPRRRLCCGRPLYEYGWLDDARRLWRRTLATLADAIDAGVPVVGLEPSCVSAFRDELPALFPEEPRAVRLAHQTWSLGELLARTDGYRPPVAAAAGHVIVHRHCHDAAVLAPEHEIALLRAAGHSVDVLDSGCCGMAGAFGFQRTKYELSVALAERVLLPAVRAAPGATVVADGFSCREQLRQLGGVRARHLAELLGPPAGPGSTG